MKNKIHFLPYVAYLNDYYLAMGYLQSSLSTEQLKDISKDLLLYYVDDMLRDRPAEYRCPQFDMLTINENCDVLTCCAIPKTHPDYRVGSLFVIAVSLVVLLIGSTNQLFRNSSNSTSPHAISPSFLATSLNHSCEQYVITIIGLKV